MNGCGDDDDVGDGAARVVDDDDAGDDDDRITTLIRLEDEFSGAWNQWIVVTMQEKSM